MRGAPHKGSLGSYPESSCEFPPLGPVCPDAALISASNTTRKLCGASDHCIGANEHDDLRLQCGTGSKTGRYQSEKGDEKRAHSDRTRIEYKVFLSSYYNY